MDTLEIPKFELMNYLPYYVIEQALEFSPADLISIKNQSTPREESRINTYLIKKKDPRNKKLQSLFSVCDFEKEVSKEVNKIMHTNTLYNAFLSTMKIDQSHFKINNLLEDTMNKENITPNKVI
jgi:hypothetical protein